MKKIMACILAAVMLTALCSCGNNNSQSQNAGSPDTSGTSEETNAGSAAAESKSSVIQSSVVESGSAGNEGSSEEGKPAETAAPAEAEVKGEVRDFGRFSALIPEGWSAADLGEADEDYNCVILKGTPEELGMVPQVSILYFLPTSLIFSAKTMYDVPRDLGEFDLGAYHWETWMAVGEDDLTVKTAEAYGNFGAVFVTLMQFDKDGELLDFEDPEIRAILESILLEPATEADWVRIDDDRVVSAELPAAEGFEWEETGSMTTNDVEVETEILDGKLTITAAAGTGVFVEKLELENEENGASMGEIEIAVRITDGRVDYLIEAVKTVNDAPEEKIIDSDPAVDYEELDELYTGIWADKNNDLTMFIQPDEEEEHGYLVSIQAADRKMSALAHIETDGRLVYEGISVNSVDTIVSSGWFAPDGDLLIWGHDEAAGRYENITVFVKIE